MKINLSVRIGKLKLDNPVIVASGTWGIEYADLSDVEKLGAVVLKTVTLDARTGNPPPRVCETASGMLNSIGLENKGVDDLIRNRLPKLIGVKTKVIVSIAGNSKNEYKELAKRLSAVRRVEAIELNLSCPNIRYGVEEGLIAHNEKAVYDTVKAVKSATKLPIITKLSPNVTDIKVFARAAEAAGSDAIALTNTFIGIAVDVNSMRPKLGNVTGGLSGPAIKPLSLRTVWEACKAVEIPVVGIGGIMDWSDAIEFMLCGAACIQVGTANFVDPNAPEDIIDGIKAFLEKNKIGDIKKLVGKVKLG